VISQTRIEITGPLSLVRGTTVYGRALGKLIPLLADLHTWSLAIHVELPLTTFTVHAASPVLLPSPPGRLIAAPFAVGRITRLLARLAPTVKLIPAPPMLRARRQLVFPDLLIDDRGQLTYVEVLAFWTKTYVHDKLAAYRELGKRVVLCVDADRGEETSSLPRNVLVYRRLVDVEQLLTRLRGPNAAGSRVERDACRPG
jgi:predicted nuclease of restriction endonuclease-like RecB superfamily